MLPRIKVSYCVIALLSSSILAFGLYNVHAMAGVTEGGVLGLTLLLRHWFQVSPSVSGFLLNGACYLMGWRLLGKEFIAYSLVSTVGFSAAYRVCEQFDPLWPQLAQMPLAGRGAGRPLCGRRSGLLRLDRRRPRRRRRPGHEPVHLTGLSIQWIYLISDLIVLGLSLTYIPLGRIAYSLLTVILSGQIIGLIQRIPLPGQSTQPLPLTRLPTPERVFTAKQKEWASIAFFRRLE